MYVYIYIYTYLSLSLYIYIYIYIYISLSLSLSLSLYIYIYIHILCVHIYIYIHMCVYMCLSLSLYIYIYVYMCIYIYIYRERYVSVYSILFYSILLYYIIVYYDISCDITITISILFCYIIITISRKAPKGTTGVSTNVEFFCSKSRPWNLKFVRGNRKYKMAVPSVGSSMGSALLRSLQISCLLTEGLLGYSR